MWVMSCAGNGRGVLKALTVNSAQNGHVNFRLMGVVILSYTNEHFNFSTQNQTERIPEYCKLMVTSSPLVSPICFSTGFLSSTAQHSGSRHVVLCRNASPVTAGH